MIQWYGVWVWEALSECKGIGEKRWKRKYEEKYDRHKRVQEINIELIGVLQETRTNSTAIIKHTRGKTFFWVEGWVYNSKILVSEYQGNLMKKKTNN